MSFQVPRRERWPYEVGDQGPDTPPDPLPGPAYKRPVLADYQLARDRWILTGDLAALWDMEDNVSLAWPRQPDELASTATALALARIARTDRPRLRLAVPPRPAIIAGLIIFLVLWPLLWQGLL